MELSDREIEFGIRKILRERFPDTAFSVSLVEDRFTLDIIGGELCKYRDNLPVQVEEDIQNAILDVYPIILYFEESEYA